MFKVYEYKACEKLMEWSTNIIKADRDSKPDIDPRDGLLCVSSMLLFAVCSSILSQFCLRVTAYSSRSYTQAPLELMRMITQQVEGQKRVLHTLARNIILPANQIVLFASDFNVRVAFFP
jgi:hypothetical protein